MYNFASENMFEKLVSAVAIGKRVFALDRIINIVSALLCWSSRRPEITVMDLSCRSCRRLEMMKRVRKMATFVRRDLLAASLYFTFASSASLDGITFSFVCDCSGFWGSWLMLAATSAYYNLCQTLQMVVKNFSASAICLFTVSKILLLNICKCYFYSIPNELLVILKIQPFVKFHELDADLLVEFPKNFLVQCVLGPMF